MMIVFLFELLIVRKRTLTSLSMLFNCLFSEGLTNHRSQITNHKSGFTHFNTTHYVISQTHKKTKPTWPHSPLLCLSNIKIHMLNRTLYQTGICNLFYFIWRNRVCTKFCLHTSSQSINTRSQEIRICFEPLMYENMFIWFTIINN